MKNPGERFNRQLDGSVTENEQHTVLLSTCSCPCRASPLVLTPVAPSDPGSVNEDPIFKGNKVPNLKVGYPGGIFDPLGFAKGDTMELETKEIKNGAQIL